MTDLDKLEAWARHQDHDAEGCEHGDQMLLKLSAELRGARKALDIIAERRFPPGWEYELAGDHETDARDRWPNRENYLVEVALHASGEDAS